MTWAIPWLWSLGKTKNWGKIIWKWAISTKKWLTSWLKWIKETRWPPYGHANIVYSRCVILANSSRQGNSLWAFSCRHLAKNKFISREKYCRWKSSFTLAKCSQRLLEPPSIFTKYKPTMHLDTSRLYSQIWVTYDNVGGTVENSNVCS